MKSKLWIPALLLVFLLLIFLPDATPAVQDGTRRTASALIADRAMSDGLPYLGVTLEDGTELCLWDLQGDAIPEEITIGETIQVTYGKQEGLDRYILLDISK